MFLTAQTRGRLFAPDTNPLRGPRSLFVDGDCSGNLSLGQWIGDEEVLMGRRFWVGCGFFSLGDGGGEEETPGQRLLSRFHRTTRVSEQPFLMFDNVICII